MSTLMGNVKRLREARMAHALTPLFPETEEDLDRIIGYEPRPLQAEITAKEKRFNSEVVHRRFGKTVMKVRKLLVRAVFCPFSHGRYGYAAPTYKMAAEIAWLYLQDYHDRLWRWFGEEDGSRHRHKGQLWAEVPDCHGGLARITLYGLDNPKQRMRGLYFDGIVLDEWAQMPPSKFAEEIRPMLADRSRSGYDRHGVRNQWADFIFTPFGRNHAHTMHQRALIWADGGVVKVIDGATFEEEEMVRDDWYACTWKASETGYVDQRELDDARQDMGENKYLQEFECSFDAAVEGAIFAGEIEKLDRLGQLGAARWNNLLPVNTAWDLGFDDATAIWFFQHVPGGMDGRGGINLIDYYEASGAGLDHFAQVLAQRGYRYGYHLFPHDVEQTELSSGRDRRSTLTQLGIRVSVVPKVKLKVDGINAGMVLLPRCAFNIERCSEGLDKLRLYRREFDQRLNVFRDKPVHDMFSHAADAFMTLATGLRSYGYTGQGWTGVRDQAHGEWN